MRTVALDCVIPAVTAVILRRRHALTAAAATTTPAEPDRTAASS